MVLAAGRAPWGNMFEFTITAMVFVVGIYLIMVWRAGVRWLGLPVTLLATIGNGLAVTVFYVAVAPLVPALHSVWFVIHIVAAAVSGAFNLGGLLSILYLIKTRADERGEVLAISAGCPPPPDRPAGVPVPRLRLPVDLHRRGGRDLGGVRLGPLLGLGPKETWALVTWVIYATTCTLVRPPAGVVAGPP